MLLGRKRKASLKRQVASLEKEVRALETKLKEAEEIIQNKNAEIKTLLSERDESGAGVLKLPGRRGRPNMRLVDSILYRTSYYDSSSADVRMMARQASTGLIGFSPRQRHSLATSVKSIWNRKARASSIGCSDGATITHNTQAVVLSGLLAKIGLFAEFDAYERLSLAKRFELREYKSGDFLIRKNQVGSHFFVLVEGHVGVFINTDGPARVADGVPQSPQGSSLHHDSTGPEASSPEIDSNSSHPSRKSTGPETSWSNVDSKESRLSKKNPQSLPSNRFLTLSPGDHFGESVLIRGAAQTASVVATTDSVTCLTLSRTEFKDMLTRFESSAMANTRAFIKHSIASQGAVDSIRQKVATAFSREEYLASVAMLEGYTLELSGSADQPGEVDYVQVMKDILREPAMVVNGRHFQVADGGSQEYSAFLEALTGHVVALVQQLNPEIGEVEASQLVVEVLKRCTRTTSGGDAYLQCNLLMGNPELVFFTPVDFQVLGDMYDTDVDDASEASAESMHQEQTIENRETDRTQGYSAAITITVVPEKQTILLKSRHQFQINHLEGGEDGMEHEQVWALVDADLTEQLCFSCVENELPVKANRAVWLQSLYHVCKRELRITQISPCD